MWLPGILQLSHQKSNTKYREWWPHVNLWIWMPKYWKVKMCYASSISYRGGNLWQLSHTQGGIETWVSWILEPASFVQMQIKSLGNLSQFYEVCTIWFGKTYFLSTGFINTSLKFLTHLWFDLDRHIHIVTGKLEIDDTCTLSLLVFVPFLEL